MSHSNEKIRFLIHMSNFDDKLDILEHMFS
jgi:hypothetical protein